MSKKNARPLDPVQQLETRDTPAAGPLADLNTVGESAFAFAQWADIGTSIGNSAYFFATDGTANPGLYKTDGTAAGTALVKDMTPASAMPAGYPTPMPATITAVGTKAFFAWDDGVNGNELWVTDGTAAGTKRVTDLAPGKGGSLPALVGAVGGRVVFVASDFDNNGGSAPNGLYASDGTTTTKLSSMYENGEYVGGFAVADGTMYFVKTTFGQSAIWSTDGTPAGTKSRATLPSGTYFVDPVGPAGPDGGAAFAVVGGNVYFAANDNANGTELWKLTGSAAEMVADINPGFFDNNGGNTSTYPMGSYPRQLTAFNGKLYFVAGDGDAHGAELWVSDGTKAGTKLAVDVTPSDTSDSGMGPDTSRIRKLTVANGKLYFSNNDPNRGYQFYVSDGTPAGTTRLTDVVHTLYPSPENPSVPYPALADPFQEAAVPVATIGNRLVFSIADKANGRQFWATDGTKAGTAVLKTFSTAGPNPWEVSFGPRDIGVVGGKLLFAADDGTSGWQLWATDGTPAGTTLVKAVNPGTRGSDPTGFVSAGGKAYFTADDGGGAGVFVTDGAGTPTLLARFGEKYDGPPPLIGGTVKDTPSQLTAAGDRVYFTVQDGQYGRQLWTTDGTKAGTKRLHALSSDVSGYNFNWQASGVTNLTAVGSTLYYTVDAKGAGQTLWRSNGTTVDQVAQLRADGVADNDYGQPSWQGGVSPVGPITAAGGKLYFAASDTTAGTEPWVSDGTAAGTERLVDLFPGGTSSNSYPTDFTPLNGKVYFLASPSGAGRELWVTDGTKPGTERVTILTTAGGPNVYLPDRAMVAAGGKLFLTFNEDTSSQSLWASDGTAVGTKRLSKVELPPTTNPYQVYYAVEQLTPVGDRLFFVRPDGDTGRQVWASDGTAAGTKLVKSIGRTRELPPYWAGGHVPVVDGSPALVRAVGNRLVFSIEDAAGTRQLWSTDGTAAGTTMVTPRVAAVGGVAVAGSKLIFAGLNSQAGAEPWSVPLAELGATVPPTSPPPVTVPPVTVPPVTVPPVTVPPVTVPPVTVPPVTVPPVTVPPVMVPPVTVPPTAPPVVVPPVTVPPVTVPPVTVPPTVPPASPPVVVPPAAAKAKLVSAPALAANEGTKATFTVATVTLPAGPTYKVTVFWGDGRTSAGTLTATTPNGRTFKITADHTYADPGTKTVLIRVTADTKTVLSIDSTAAVADARFYAGRVAERVKAGSPFSGVVASIQDTRTGGGKAADYTATIDWGNGKTSAGTVRKTAAGKLEVVGGQSFDTTGRRTVTVTITSVASGKTATALSIFTVDPAAKKQA